MAYYVNMTDKFMSGWGLAPGKSYLSIACETIEQAEAIERAALDRKEMRRVAISYRPRKGKPGFDHTRFLAFSDMSGTWLSYARNYGL